VSLPHHPGGRGILFAYLGMAVPALVALVLLPDLIRNLGVERFGVLSLLLAIAGFFNAFDFGVGVAVSRYTARLDSRTVSRGAVRRLVRRSLWLQLLIGGVTGVALIGSHAAFSLVTTPTGELRSEIGVAVWLLATSIPLGLVAGVIRCALEGLGRFGTANLLRAPATISTFAVPICVSFLTQRLDLILFSLLAVRVLAALLFVLVWSRVAPADTLMYSGRHAIRHVRLLLSYGGWVMLGMIAGGLITLGVLDRFLVGRLLGAISILQYSVPSDVVVRCLLAPAAICSVLIPQLSRAMARHGRMLLEPYVAACQLMAHHAGPVALLVVLNARLLLETLTAGNASAASVSILQGLAVGFFIHAIAHVPYCALHALGRPNLASLRHVIELPLYLVAALALFSHGLLEWSGALWALWAMADLLLILVILRGTQRTLPLALTLCNRPVLVWVALLIGATLLKWIDVPPLWMLLPSMAVASYFALQIAALLRHDHKSLPA
jgi:O-antigen/teichoic acid export membrane protein